MNTLAKVKLLKEVDEDFEWYPTTDAIIDTIASDIRENTDSGDLLDVGAGDGRVLVSLKEKLSSKYDGLIDDVFAIEKSLTHIHNMPKSIVVLGTEFFEQTLVDKVMKFIFCNPPYSEYEQWVVKLISEAAATYLYVVIPCRWVDSVAISRVIKDRGAEVETLGVFNFENADRRARARVEVLRIELPAKSTAAFDAVLETMLPDLKQWDNPIADDPKPSLDAAEIIQRGESLVDTLVAAYDAEAAALVEAYRDVTKIKPGLLRQLGVCKNTILTGLRSKLTGLKSRYWKVLFDELQSVGKRLATRQRAAFLASLDGKATIDFTESNIYSVLVWVTKWANDYYDEQLIDLFSTLSRECNVVKYRSNEKVWTKSDWRYLRNRDELHTHYKLDHRLVVSKGGIYTGSYSFESKAGLTEQSYDFIRDCVTVANNLGYDSDASPGDYRWVSNKRITLPLSNGRPLVAVRAFKNGNMHMHFSQRIMLAINVEAGRLLGWLRSPEEAVSELQVEGEDAEYVQQVFGSSFRIAPNTMLRIG